MAKRMKHLALTGPANALYQQIMARGVVPSSKPRDGLQIAIATAHEIDYLLSWNYAHLANPIVQAKLEKLCQAFGLRYPVLVSPETIPSARLGETIRRRLK